MGNPRSSRLSLGKPQRDQGLGGLFVRECVTPGWSLPLSPRSYLGMTLSWCKPKIAGSASISRQPLQQHTHPRLPPPPKVTGRAGVLWVSSSFRAADACLRAQLGLPRPTQQPRAGQPVPDGSRRGARAGRSKRPGTPGGGGAGGGPRSGWGALGRAAGVWGLR